MDEFPTLEVAAALGVLIALARTFILARAFVQLTTLNRRLVPLVAESQLARALTLSEAAEPTPYLRLVRRALFALRDLERSAEPSQARQTLEQAVDAAYAVEARRAQSGSAHDLVALTILSSTCVYAAGTALGVSRWFYALGGAAVLLLAWNVWARPAVLARARAAVLPLIEAAERAALEAGATAPAHAPREASSRCPECGGRLDPLGHGGRLVTPDGRERGLTELAVCSGCGRIGGRAQDDG
ncbi:MAG: zinc ribbon domain-containing protein [Sorangiineae bacterium]|nr:zinc ribbon domain-containing protein [Polyangiaceae bacterium]MEB2323102.1 zinc ribbon domain-containing protein [Sorangiineae bacterium]